MPSFSTDVLRATLSQALWSWDAAVDSHGLPHEGSLLARQTDGQQGPKPIEGDQQDSGWRRMVGGGPGRGPPWDGEALEGIPRGPFTMS